MARVNVRRLLNAFIPFSIMALVQRGLLLVLGFLNLPQNITDLIAFIPSSLCCALIFSLIKDRSASDEEYDEIPPLTKKNGACSFMQTAVTLAVLVAAMFAVSVLVDESLADKVEFSVFSVVSLIIIHPIIEEYVFRGLIYREMRRMNPIFAMLAQAVMFAIVHDTVNGMLYALVAGMILAVLVELSGRLSTSIAAHMIINLRSLIYMTLLADKPDLINMIDVMIFVLGAISLVGLVVIRGFGDGASNDGAEEEADGEIVEVSDDEE